MTAPAANDLVAACRQYVADGRIDDAHGAVTARLARVPDDPTAWLIRGMLFQQSGQPADAADAYREVLRLQPDRVDALYNLGVALRALGDRDGAVHAYERVLALSPNHPDAAFNLGNTRLADGDTAGAVTLFQKALSHDPGRSDIRQNLAKALNDRGDVPAAAEAVARAVAADPENFQARLLRVVVHILDPLSPNAKAAVSSALRHADAHPAEKIWLFIQQAIMAWIENRPVDCQTLLAAAGPMDPFHCRTAVEKSRLVYEAFLRDLCTWWDTHPQDVDGGLPELFLAGDSHCLAPAHTGVVVNGARHRIVPRLIMGAKAYHLGVAGPNPYRAAFDRWMTGLAADTPVALMFGEIDCRADGGILPAWKRHGNGRSLIEMVTATVDAYVAHVADLAASRGIRPLFCTVPAPRPEAFSDLGDGDRERLLQIVSGFGRRLTEQCRRRGFGVIDLYGLTAGAGGAADGRWHLDRYHLIPDALAEAARTAETDPVAMDGSANRNRVVENHQKGVALQREGRLPEALAAYRRAVAEDPALAPTWANMGGILTDQNRLAEARDVLDRALSLDPNLDAAWLNRARVAEIEGRTEAAIADYRNALSCAPDNAKALAQLVFLGQKVCAWEGLGALEARLDAINRKALAAGRPAAESPFKSIARTEDPALNAAIARSRSASIRRRAEGLAIRLPARPVRPPGARITIGYLSDRFRNAATGHQMAGIFGLHDRTRFRIHTYSYGEDDGSTYRHRIIEGSDFFADIAGLDDLAAARLIRGHGVDILVDLKGHTQNHRLGIAALRPSPVQVAYLGFPGTSGADFFDYILADPVVAPTVHAAFFSEKPITLPHCYYPTDHRQPVDPGHRRREEFGLRETDFVFCSFNQPFKIDPILFACWTAILKEVPQSVLWLQDFDPAATRNLRREARQRGIPPDRLVFSGSLPKPAHLARLALADLCLDTRVYNGHTTTVDALWMGVPVVTLMGHHFASRVSASMLAALGCDELVTDTLDGYRALAVALARDRDRLRRVREKVAAHRRIMPLFDTPRFVRDLERGYLRAWKIFAQGGRPRPITVAEDTGVARHSDDMPARGGA